MRKILSIVWILIFALAVFADQKPKSNWAKFENNKIHYYDIGKQKNKDALVFVHGWTCSADFWDKSYASFPEYRVIAVDLIGHGQSDKPQAVYSMEYFAKSIEAVLKEAKVNRAVLVGHSMGTPVARQFYRLFPEKTLGIVIVDGGLRMMGTKEQTEQFLTPLRTNYKENAPKMLDFMLAPVKDANLKQIIRASMLATPEHVAVSAMVEMSNEKLYTNDKINVPVLAIMAQSPFWKPDEKEFFQSIAPDIDFQMWKDVSHFLMMEKPSEFNSEVKSFIVKKKLL